MVFPTTYFNFLQSQGPDNPFGVGFVNDTMIRSGLGILVLNLPSSCTEEKCPLICFISEFCSIVIKNSANTQIFIHSIGRSWCERGNKPGNTVITNQCCKEILHHMVSGNIVSFR